MTSAERWAILDATRETDELATIHYGNGVSIEPATGVWLYGMVRRLCPKYVVETGTNVGYATGWMAAAMLDANRPVSIWTVDHVDRPRPLWDALGLGEGIVHEVADARTCELPYGAEQVEFMFLDADHETTYVLAEWDRFRSMRAPHGWVIWHDANYGPERAALGEIEEREGQPLIYVPTMRGLALLPPRGAR